MSLLHLIPQIWHELWLRKLRSFLAIFCVAWGTLTVVMLTSLSDGFYAESKKSVMVIADGSFMFIPSQTSKAYHGFPRGQKFNIKAATIINLPKVIPHLTAASPILTSKTNISYRGKQLNKIVYGVSTDFIKMRRLTLVPGGRYFTRKEMANAKRVAILGDKLKNTLFGENNALGKQVLINNIPFVVIAVVDAPFKNIYNPNRSNAIIPYSTYTSLWGDKNVAMFLVLADPKFDSDEVKENVRNYLAYKYHFDKTDSGALKIFGSTDMLNFLNWFFLGIKMFLLACGALTLAVGTLGVTNIMFLIVAERTREIGLRKALGARDWHILLQILVEAKIIIGIGGFVGFMLAYLMTLILRNVKLPEWLGTPYISWSTTLITILILAIFGVLSGFFPARRAAVLDPVEALAFKK